MTRIAILASAIALLTTPVAALAGDLSGTVRDSTAQPVAGVQVAIPALGIATTTDADGGYRFEGLDAGDYRIAVELAEDIRQHASATVPENGEVTRNVFLYSRAAMNHARNGVNPVEAMLADMLLAQAWEEASELAAQGETAEPRALPDLVG